MIGCEGEVFANKVTRYGASLRVTKQYWFRERNRLIAMIDTLGCLPSFTLIVLLIVSGLS